MSKQTHEYQFHEVIEDIGIINEKAKEGWKVHTFSSDLVSPGEFYCVLFEREVN